MYGKVTLLAGDYPFSLCQARDWLRTHPLEEYPFAQEWNSSVGDEQLDWLEAELIEAREAGEKVLHHLRLLALRSVFSFLSLSSHSGSGW